MDSILVVNAGSSSVKFKLFAVDGSVKLTRKIKGQIDGIATRRRFRASGPDRTSLGLPMGTRPGQIDPGVILI